MLTTDGTTFLERLTKMLGSKPAAEAVEAPTAVEPAPMDAAAIEMDRAARPITLLAVIIRVLTLEHSLFVGEERLFLDEMHPRFEKKLLDEAVLLGRAVAFGFLVHQLQ